MFRSRTASARPASGRVATYALVAALVVAVVGGVAAASATGTPPRVPLPDPRPGWLTGTAVPADPHQVLSLRIYLAGRPGRIQAAQAVSTPGSPGYAHYLTPVQYRSRYGPTAAQIADVGTWLRSQGLTITAIDQHFITADGSVAQIDSAFATHLGRYPFGTLAPIDRASIPATVAADVATVTGLEFQPTDGVPPIRPTRDPEGSSPVVSTLARAAAATASTPVAGFPCSRYQGQHSVRIPRAYGRTTAPTVPCGYTPTQLRRAYGVADSPYTGRGTTIAIVLDGRSPTMAADANTFFAHHHIPGFRPGQYTENVSPTFASTCGGTSDVAEEAIDVETAHIAAPDANVVYVGADCPRGDGRQQALLDAQTRVVDAHLADVTSESFSILASGFSAADTVAWELTFQQGAIEGIGFDFGSGDGGDLADAPGVPTSVLYPASDPWATSVGGTSLEIGADGRPVAEYGWGDNAVGFAAAGYASPPPGRFEDGSTGGASTRFAEPDYQRGVVPPAMTTVDGGGSAHRVSPDVSADAGLSWLIGFTGATEDGGYGETAVGGGTSGSAPLVAGLEADATQAAGHALGFVNPALYRLNGTSAVHDVLPVPRDHPPVLAGAQPFLGDGAFLTTLGADSSLRTGPGYDDVTGLGSPTRTFVTAFTRF